MVTAQDLFLQMIDDAANGHERPFIESMLVVEDKLRRRVPFIYNAIQADADATETGMDIWVKPSSIGFSTERIAKRLVNTLLRPGTNTVLIAYEDFITTRLLSKVSFFYNHLASLQIPGFPEIHHDSDFQKTFQFKDAKSGQVISTSSIYIASARSKTAGRAEVIHHLLLDEHAFYVPEATERIIAPAMARIPPGGTVDSFSTPNGEDNEFHQWYVEAKSGNSIFTPHFYPWFLHKEYAFGVDDPRAKHVQDGDKPQFKLSLDEELLQARGLSYNQIRWRRYMIKVQESLRRSGQSGKLFQQEFPEDDVSCFLATGDMYFDVNTVENMAKQIMEPCKTIDNALIWHLPEKGRKYIVAIDPGQAKITQTAIIVITYRQDELGIFHPVVCARDSGLYLPDLTAKKAMRLSDMYNTAMIAWEANSHGMAITELLKNRRPIYYRKDIASGITSVEPGWLTSNRTKDYMMDTVVKYLPDIECPDIELVRQMRNHKLQDGKLVVTGPNDIFMAFALGLVCFDPKPIKRGKIGQYGWKW